MDVLQAYSHIRCMARTDAHEEVVGLDVSVYEMPYVQELDAGDHLVSQLQHRLEREAAVAEVEEVLQGGPQARHDHGVVLGRDLANPLNQGKS